MRNGQGPHTGLPRPASRNHPPRPAGKPGLGKPHRESQLWAGRMLAVKASGPTRVQRNLGGRLPALGVQAAPSCPAAWAAPQHCSARRCFPAVPDTDSSPLPSAKTPCKPSCLGDTPASRRVVLLADRDPGPSPGQSCHPALGAARLPVRPWSLLLASPASWRCRSPAAGTLGGEAHLAVHTSCGCTFCVAGFLGQQSYG